METEDKMRVRGPEAGQGLVKWRMTYFREIDLQRFRNQLNKTIRNEQSLQCPTFPKLEFGMTQLSVYWGSTGQMEYYFKLIMCSGEKNLSLQYSRG